MSHATVTMPVDEYMSLKKQLEEKESVALDLNKKLAARPAESDASELTKLARAMLPVVQFAVANCSPRDIRRWPWKNLVDIAEKLKALPDHTIYDDELATELLKFAAECEEWEIKRRTTPEKEVPLPFPIQAHPIVQLQAGKMPESAKKITMVTPPDIDSIDQELLSKRSDQAEQDVEPNS